MRTEPLNHFKPLVCYVMLCLCQSCFYLPRHSLFKRTAFTLNACTWEGYGKYDPMQSSQTYQCYGSNRAWAFKVWSCIERAAFIVQTRLVPFKMFTLMNDSLTGSST